MDLQPLYDLADQWEKAGLAYRQQRHEEAATAMIGCAQALRNALTEINP